MALAVVIAAPAYAQAPAIVSNLRASDVNGFRLGEPIAEVRARARLTPLGRGDFEAVVDGVSYNFGFTPGGRLYRIESTQTLGAFVPDRAFTVKLSDQLSTKYGPPASNSLPDGTALWTYAATVTQPDGSRTTSPTESLEVMLLGGYGQPVELNVKLLDFRYLWADEAARNADPSAAAGRALKF